MEHKHFNLTHLSSLVELRNFDGADAYMSQFFFKSGCNVYFRCGLKNEFILYKDTDASKLLPNDLIVYDKGREIYNAKKFLNSTRFKQNEYKPTIDFNIDDVIFSNQNRQGIPVNYINMGKPKPSFETIIADREKCKEDLQKVYNHILTIWANNDKEIYEWILNFLACSITAKRKLRQCLYLPCSVERAGRGSILNFINNMIGDRMYKTCSLEELLKYNKNFEGRCLINFDELPTDVGNFRSVSDTLKSLITEPLFPCRDMYNKPYEQKNTFNIIITSNNEAVKITQSNNSRYMICNINTERVGDHKYFKTLNAILNNPVIQKLFYEDMEARVLNQCSKWNEDIKPFSSSKQEKLIETLPRVLKYIKDEFVLKNIDLDLTTTKFFEMYYQKTGDRTSKQKINKELIKVGINVKKIRDGDKTYSVYRVDASELYKNYEKCGFIDNDLEYIDDNQDNTEKTKYKELQQKYKELEEKYNELLESKKNKIVEPAKTRKLIIKKPKIEVKEIRKAIPAQAETTDNDDLDF
jgi:hypothetical protein